MQLPPPQSPLSLADPLSKLIGLLGLEEMFPRLDLDAALQELEAALLVLASEALAAQVADVPIELAAVDFERFPHLARFHATVDDVLGLELTRQLEKWGERFLNHAPVEALEVLRRDLVLCAKNDPMPLRRALFRFLLLEGVRLNLLVQARLFPHEVFGSGAEQEDVDAIAASEVTFWLQSAAIDAEDVRPFTVIVASACEAFSEHLQGLRSALLTVSRELRDSVCLRAEAEAALGTMNSADALLLRNELAELLDQQPLSMDRLHERHPVAFGRVKRGALYQRKHALSKRAKSGVRLIKRRKRLAMIDLIAKHLGVSHGSGAR